MNDFILSAYGTGTITVSYVNANEVELLTEDSNIPPRWTAIRLTDAEKRELAKALLA